MDTQKQHGEAVRLALDELAEYRSRLLQTGHEMVTAGDGMYEVDLFAIGAVKRAISLAKGFEVLIYAWNLMCARALLRMQIDTAIRFSALRLVDNPNSFAKEVFSGKQINKLKDRDGARMTDARLVAHLAPDAPWLPEVYRNTSGYVHFSGDYIFAPIYRLEDETHTVWFAVNEEDYKFPESSWLEVIKCFRATTALFLRELEAWVVIKKSWSKEDGQSEI